MKFDISGNPAYGDLTVALEAGESFWSEGGAMSRMSSHLTSEDAAGLRVPQIRLSASLSEGSRCSSPNTPRRKWRSLRFQPIVSWHDFASADERRSASI